MKYFLFAMLFLLSANNILAQDFFVPNGAFSSVQDKLEPIAGMEEKVSTRKQRRYQIIDGRIYALDDIEEVVEQNDTPKNHETESEKVTKTKDFIEQTPSSHLPVVEKIPSNIPDVPSRSEEILPSADIAEPQENIVLPQRDNLPQTAPLYKKRYDMYLSDLEKFQRTKKMPENKDLKTTLQKLSKKQEMILFQGVLK